MLRERQPRRSEVSARSISSPATCLSRKNPELDHLRSRPPCGAGEGWQHSAVIVGERGPTHGVWRTLCALPRPLCRWASIILPGDAATGGAGGIRTHGTLARTTVFETVPIDHSGTSPGARV